MKQGAFIASCGQVQHLKESWYVVYPEYTQLPRKYHPPKASIVKPTFLPLPILPTRLMSSSQKKTTATSVGLADPLTRGMPSAQDKSSTAPAKSAGVPSRAHRGETAPRISTASSQKLSKQYHRSPYLVAPHTPFHRHSGKSPDFKLGRWSNTPYLPPLIPSGEQTQKHRSHLNSVRHLHLVVLDLRGLRTFPLPCCIPFLTFPQLGLPPSLGQLARLTRNGCFWGA